MNSSSFSNINDDKINNINKIVDNLHNAKIRRQDYFNTLGPQILSSVAESISMAFASSNSIILNALAPYIHSSLHYIT